MQDQQLKQNAQGRFKFVTCPVFFLDTQGSSDWPGLGEKAQPFDTALPLWSLMGPRKAVQSRFFTCARVPSNDDVLPVHGAMNIYCSLTARTR